LRWQEHLVPIDIDTSINTSPPSFSAFVCASLRVVLTIDHVRSPRRML
jgi:hypothetical protein